MSKPTSATLYGIANCDQCRRAKAWLAHNRIHFKFFDLKLDGLTPSHLEQWLKHLPWDSLLNRRGTTWRQIPPEERAKIVDQQSAVSAIMAQPTLLKRPLVTHGDIVLVGFNPELWASLLH